MRVLLADGPSTTFSGSTAAGRQSLAASTTYTVSANDGRLQLSGAGAAAPLMITGPGPLRVAGQGTYRGSLQLSADGHGGVLTVDVVGTRGSTSVTGTQLQGAFGLATTDAAFTTISTTAAHGALTGSVYPARAAGGSVTVQRLGPGGWTTIAHAPLAAGAFTWPAPIAGRYRITYRSLGGPAVNQP